MAGDELSETLIRNIWRMNFIVVLVSCSIFIGALHLFQLSNVRYLIYFEPSYPTPRWRGWCLSSSWFFFEFPHTTLTIQRTGTEISIRNSHSVIDRGWYRVYRHVSCHRSYVSTWTLRFVLLNSVQTNTEKWKLCHLVILSETWDTTTTTTHMQFSLTDLISFDTSGTIVPASSGFIASMVVLCTGGYHSPFISLYFCTTSIAMTR